MYKYKKHKKVKFARFGGLSSVKQKGYDASMPTFHSPPARKGIYAFIYPYIEMFLLSGKQSSIESKHSKFEYIKDHTGKTVEFPLDEWNTESEKAHNNVKDKYLDLKNMSLSDWDDWEYPKMDNKKFNKYRKERQHIDEKKNTVRFIKKKDMKVFEYDGLIWSHLGEYVKRHSDIIKENGSWVLTEYDVFIDALNKCFHEMGKDVLSEKMYSYKPSDEFIVTKTYSKDHLEVFIEKV